MNWLKSLNGEKCQILAAILAVALLLWLQSCVPKTQSILNPPTRITSNELSAEVEMFNARLQDRVSDLLQQEQFKQMFFEQLSLLSSQGNINPVGVITSIGLILGFGAVGDNIRKRTEIKKLKKSENSS